MVVALATFAAASALLIVLPGPDNMLVVRNALRHGRFVGLRTAAGTLTGVAIWVLGAASGISALLSASRIGYDVLRVLGVASTWCGWGSGPCDPTAGRPSMTSGPCPTAQQLRVAVPGYVMGVLSNLANPKTGAFFIALFPAFIPRGSSVEATSLLFGALFLVEAAAWFAILIWLVSQSAAWVSKHRVQRRLEQISGLFLIGFAVRLATERR